VFAGALRAAGVAVPAHQLITVTICLQHACRQTVTVDIHGVFVDMACGL